jgi:hypothetical protein
VSHDLTSELIQIKNEAIMMQFKIQKVLLDLDKEIGELIKKIEYKLNKDEEGS